MILFCFFPKCFVVQFINELKKKKKNYLNLCNLAAALNRDVLLHFGVLHVSDGVSGVPLALFQVPRPHVVHPVDLIHLQPERHRQTDRESFDGAAELLSIARGPL